MEVFIEQIREAREDIPIHSNKVRDIETQRTLSINTEISLIFFQIQHLRPE